MKLANMILRGKAREVNIHPELPTVTIGERCNALGYKSVRESVEAGEFGPVVERALAQVAAGVDIVNVNMVGMKVSEREALPRAVELIAQAVDVPLSLDFGDPEALVAALKVAPGRPLINSVNGEERKLGPILEIAAQYRCPLIALPSDEKGVPDTAAGRLACAARMIDRAASFGITTDDLLFDGICIAVATDMTAARTTFETIRLMRKELGLNITLGASNVSHGLPKRKTLDSYYLAMAVMAGMNAPITDLTLPALKWAILSADVCAGTDEYGMRYIAGFREEEKAKAAALGVPA
ncbi:MAG: dihydropteroate synthase [Spirochaetes bacterium]|nr:dihydropteroate synthase [Spirochaetota bacterium]